MAALPFGEAAAGADLPAGTASVRSALRARAAPLTADVRLPVFSCAGGWFGWVPRRLVPREHVPLELGAATAVVLADSDPEVGGPAYRAAGRPAGRAGGTSVRRAIAENAVRGGRVAESGPGAEALESGALPLPGGERDGGAAAPTVPARVPAEAGAVREEVFGRVPALRRASGADDAAAPDPRSGDGLQTGGFTRDRQAAFRAHRELQVGVSSSVTHPPTGPTRGPTAGPRGPGPGREGVRSAMDGLTRSRVRLPTGVRL